MGKERYDLFVGCYGSKDEETIHWLEFDREEGTILKVTSFSGVENPSYLTIDSRRKCLYVISEVEQGEIISFDIDYKNKAIHERNRQPTKGSPCFVEIGGNNNYLFTANYGGGSIIVYKLNRHGDIEQETDFIEHQPKKYSTNSRLHTIRNVPGTSNYVATDLGLNKLYLYDFQEQDGLLKPIQEVDLPNGSGPRHVAFHPSLNRMYVVNEFNSTILVYSYDIPITTIQLEQVISTVPPDFKGKNYGAEIHITSSGSYVYVSNRGHHSISMYSVLPNGNLNYLSHIPTFGEWPRHFTVLRKNNDVIIANEHTNNLVVMGMQNDVQPYLKLGKGQITLARPVCIKVFT